MESLLDICFPSVLTKDVLDECDKFTCGDDESVIIACFTVSNDSIRIFDLGSSKKNRMWKEISNREKRLSRYPGILIGRLAVSTNFSGCGYGSEVLRFVKEWFVDDANKSGCRLAIVDAKVCLGIS